MFDYSKKISLFGTKFFKKSGILELMEDLGNANQRGDALMLGGGNPAHIPEIEDIFHETLAEIIQDKEKLMNFLGNYDPPEGSSTFKLSLAQLLQSKDHFAISPANIAITPGSQSAFFILFNLFAGKFPDGNQKKVVLPYVPEYIGYAEQGLSTDFFQSFRPRIEEIDDIFFKYRIDFDTLKITEDTGAICISRPTNPSGNVVTDSEIDRLYAMAQIAEIPLIIDNAYGNPFPGMIFTEATLSWRPGMILVMSLSKMGLPGTRTGIIIADEEVIKLVSAANAIINLANNNIGQAIAEKLITNNQILQMSQKFIRPFYQKKSSLAIEIVKEEFKGLDYKIHASEGALFLWIWFKNLPVTSKTLYHELKKRKVIIVPGEYFFPGFQEDWQHQHECIRLSFAQEDEILKEGIKIIGETVKQIYNSPSNLSL